MRLIALILPFVRRVSRANAHDQEAKDIIREIESVNSLQPQQFSPDSKA
jgi:hypothetical protein